MVLRRGSFSIRFRRRTAHASVVLLVIAGALGVLGLCQGAVWLSPAELFSGRASVVVLEWRLPRVVAALVFGAALALAGAVIQNLTRNPLGSPDVLGIEAGSYTGALLVITGAGVAPGLLTGAAMLGGVLSAAVVYVLSVRSGLDRTRLVVIGIAVNAMLVAVDAWIVLRAELEVAMAATGWSAGSLNGIDWDDLQVPLVVVGALMVLFVALSGELNQSTVGDEMAIATGVQLGRLRLVTVLAAVACSATVTAVTGPIVFIALAAPQIGRRLFATPGVGLLPAALTGGVLLLAADIVARVLLAPVALPVGVVTTAIGGCYLLWLLLKEVR
ncbi:iron chelate uptake ABC transporter family permease subunit [Allokutzneria sp. A3M-2-11 16]|uniref:FecCD family ABC transporter permease n=1 Tax=Allokutzneria sp. A3M-2-11 16 TaxID=2962043 RepID=UPI0020B8A37D|nr:iron chelate uptake ABC transporter family permease subunit [Allokutzneria sp. A3M-2-11 16]MCP3803046.1 iron chelate uptake ABC transporter family permease subunit [Allokutzneria sp. A3M-2-11 16]